MCSVLTVMFAYEDTIGMVVMGWRLGLLILEVFSNLYDSIILFAKGVIPVLAFLHVSLNGGTEPEKDPINVRGFG